MDDELISKKELLELTNISYGQLYRWKRKNLIPEEWFIRKSTFTGQETFFPKDKILARIKLIVDMKEDISLDNLAEVFSPTLNDLQLDAESIISKGAASREVFEIYTSIKGQEKSYGFTQIIPLYLFGKLLESGNLSADESRLVLETYEQNHDQYPNGCMLCAMRKLGVFSCLIAERQSTIHFDSGTKIISTIQVNSLIEELKLKLI